MYGIRYFTPRLPQRGQWRQQGLPRALDGIAVKVSA